MIIRGRLNKNELVPPVEQIAREMTESSQVMIIIKRALKLNPGQIIRLGINNLVYLPKLVKKDFATGVKLLCELTILANSRTKSWILHAQMTDMAVALNNKDLIRDFLRLARVYGFRPAIATNNLGELLIMLADTRHVPNNLRVFGPRIIGQGLKDYMTQSNITFIEWSRHEKQN